MRYSLPSFVSVAFVAVFACATHLQPAAAQPHPGAGGGPTDSGTGTTGKVVETMNAGSYTYVQVDDGAKKIWAAAPKFAVAVGDTVVVPDGMAMRDFQSKALGRTFDLVYFVSGIQVVGGQALKEPLAAAHGGDNHGAHGSAAQGAAHTAATAGTVDLSNIPKAAGGQTVAELFANKAALAGTDVAVRGRVVKFTPQVMGKNWIHVQDGTGSSGANDLAVSTNATAAVGNTVLVRGKLSTDRDLGFGYHYDVIIEDAAVGVE